MIKFYRKDDGSLTIKEYEAQFAPHEVIDNETSRCQVCGLTWRPDYDDPCLCKDVVDFDGDVDYNAYEVFDLLQPLIAGAYELGLNPDRKSTRLNSSHITISYAVFCLKKNPPYPPYLIYLPPPPPYPAHPPSPTPPTPHHPTPPFPPPSPPLF